MSAAAPLLIQAAPPSWRSRLNPAYLPLVATLLVLAVLFIVGGAQYDRFLSVKTFSNLLVDSSFLAVAAIGATIVILSGGIDLSIGAVVAFTSILMAKLIEPSIGAGMHPVSAALIALAIGTAFGAFLGTLIALYDLPPFMVTLSGMFLARAMAFVVHESSLGVNHPFFNETLANLAWHVSDSPGRVSRSGRVGPPIPIYVQPTAMLMLAMFVLATVLMHLTSFGRNVYAIGGDEHSATLLGVRVRRVKIAVYALSGFLSALAGVIATVYNSSGDPAAFYGLELDAIAAVVIGGTLLTGGRGFVIGTLLGVLLLGLIQTFITFNGKLRQEDTRMFIAGLMLAFILMQGGFNAFGKWLGRAA
jgi:simple sugar transport system permease protein